MAEEKSSPPNSGHKTSGSRSELESRQLASASHRPRSEESDCTYPDAFLFEGTGLAEAYRAIRRRARELSR